VVVDECGGWMWMGRADPSRRLRRHGECVVFAGSFASASVSVLCLLCAKPSVERNKWLTFFLEPSSRQIQGESSCRIWYIGRESVFVAKPLTFSWNSKFHVSQASTQSLRRIDQGSIYYFIVPFFNDFDIPSVANGELSKFRINGTIPMSIKSQRPGGVKI
jgi:hypothetical protein